MNPLDMYPELSKTIARFKENARRQFGDKFTAEVEAKLNERIADELADFDASPAAAALEGKE
ncbi:hypothetical protein KDX01_20195 [Burkholderia vietnamiensis]|uniref:hypothetical protein n=1 Tax=Burkholderia vietnamiensis TaxID=60552 RepID=UPI001B9F7B28|nr:hypothetical protein [Burkholderia vietnamiensis]MBR7975413.1 hypothetical protein [Burkholderia vietnamiensis]